MRRRAVVVGLALSIGGSVGVAAVPAGAQDPVYPPSNHCGIQLSLSTVRPDQSFTITGTQGAPNIPVTITFESTPVVIATTTTDASGAFQVEASVPAGAEPGVHTVRANGQTSCAAHLELEAAPSTSPYRGGAPGLAFTGANPLLFVLVALILVTIGFVLVASERRQRISRENIRRQQRERQRTLVG